MGARTGALNHPATGSAGGLPPGDAMPLPWMARLLALLAAKPGAQGGTTDVTLDELAAAGLGNPLGLALLLAPLPPGLAEPAVRDRLGHVHVGVDAVERLAAGGQGVQAFYRFDLARLRAALAQAIPART